MRRKMKALGGAPFDLSFFASVFAERVLAVCPEPAERLPVVVLHLADGSVLDLCHIELLTPRWMAVAVFRGAVSCDEMDTVLVPYEMILRITLSPQDAQKRRLGFDMGRSAAALKPAG